MKKENGLTLVATIFWVLLIAILVFAVIYYTRMELSKETVEDMKTNMLLVQAKVKKIEGDYILEKKDELLIGTKLSELKDEDYIKEFLEKGLFDTEEKGKKYYVLNQENLNSLGLEKILLEDSSCYIVEYTNAKVYYTKGFEYLDGNIYYSIDDIKEESEEDKTEKLEENNETKQDENSEK